jgi:hypothetical protein
VIPTLMEVVELLGLRPVFVPIVIALLSTGLLLVAQSIARLFEDRNS